MAVGNLDPLLLPDLSAALARIDGIPCESVSVTGGALHAIERIVQAHFRPGDRIAVEDPDFTHVIDLVAALGFEPVPVAVDDEGPKAESLAAALARGVRAFIVTPRAENPTGGS